MTTVTIDKVEYNIEDFTEAATECTQDSASQSKNNCRQRA